MNQQNLITKHNFSIEPFHAAPIPTKDFKSTGIERKKHLQAVCKLPVIEGEILEFGVFQGKTIKHIANAFPNKIIWGFDSFEGLPEDWPIWHRDKLDPQNIKHKKGYFAVDTLPEVKENVKLWKGWFEDTIPQYIKQQQPKQISFLHVDGDLYSSAKTNLFQLEKYIVKDTIICFDELYAFGRKPYETWEEGEYKALKEWTTKFNREFGVLSHNLHQQSTIRIVK